MQIVVNNQIQRVTLPASAKSLVVDPDPQRRNLVAELITNMGFSTIESVAEISAITDRVFSDNSAQNLFLVLYTEIVSALILRQLKDLLAYHPMPVLVLTNDLDKDLMARALKSGVSAFISLDVQSNRMKHAINSAFANFDLVNELKKQITLLEDRLDNRIVVDKAKGLIMKNRNLDEAQAYEYLRQYAMKKGKKLIEVAEMTIATAELLDKDF